MIFYSSNLPVHSESKRFFEIFSSAMAQSAKTQKKVYFAGRTMDCLPERLKSRFFEIFLSGVKKKFQKTLILVFEENRATTQSPNTHFLLFQKQQKINFCT